MACSSGLAKGSWLLTPLDTCTARTTIRLWHELHVARKVPHDFMDLLAPQRVTSGMFWGAVRCDDIRAIAYCSRCENNIPRIVRVAHAPDQPDASVALLHLLNRERIEPDWDALRTQPRWFCEEIFALLEMTATASTDP